MPPQPGASARLTFEVTDGDTARDLGSGDLDVLATPRLLAWCERVTCEIAGSDDGSTSVGTRMQLQHLLATPVGGRVTVEAALTHVDGRLLRFDVSATDRQGRLAGTGEITRVAVDCKRFLSRLPPA